MYITLWLNFRGRIPRKVWFYAGFSHKIDGFRQKDSQGFERTHTTL